MNIKKSIKIALAALFVAVTPSFAQLPDNDNDQTDEIDNYDFLYSEDGNVDNYDVASMENLMDEAFSLIGTRYRSGASGPGGFDCSGFTSYLYKQMGIDLNRSSRGQYTQGEAVASSNLQTGDLVFFKKPGSTTSKPVTHVGMYIGSGQFVHASDYGVGVIVSNLSDAYYTTGYVSARRIAV